MTGRELQAPFLIEAVMSGLDLHVPVLPVECIFNILTRVIEGAPTPGCDGCPVQTLCAAACVSRAWRDAAADPSLWRSLVFTSSPRATRPWLTDARLAQLVRRSEGGLLALDITGCAWPAVTVAGVAAALAGYEGKLSRMALDGVVLPPGDKPRRSVRTADSDREDDDDDSDEEGEGGDDDEGEGGGEEGAEGAEEMEEEEAAEDDDSGDDGDEGEEEEEGNREPADRVEAAVSRLKAFLRPAGPLEPEADDDGAGIFEGSADKFDNRFTNTHNLPDRVDDGTAAPRFFACAGKGFSGGAVGEYGDCGRLASNVVCNHCSVALCVSCSMCFRGKDGRLISGGVLCGGCGCPHCGRALGDGMQRFFAQNGAAAPPPYAAAAALRRAEAAADWPPSIGRAASICFAHAEAAAVHSFLSEWVEWTSGRSAASISSSEAGGGKPPNVWRMVCARPSACTFCHLNLCGVCTGILRKGPSASCSDCGRGPMCARCAAGHLACCGGAGCQRAFCRDCIEVVGDGGGSGGQGETPLTPCAGCGTSFCAPCFKKEGDSAGVAAAGTSAACCECKRRFCAGCVGATQPPLKCEGAAGSSCGGFICAYCGPGLLAAGGGSEAGNGEVAARVARCTSCCGAEEEKKA